MESHSQSSPAVTAQEKAKVLHFAIGSMLKTSYVLLATAQVLIVSERDEIRKVRALFDQGSEISLISERVVQQLRLAREYSSLSLVGIGEQKSNKTFGRTSFKLRSHFSSEIVLVMSAYILPKLTTSIPSIELPQHSWPHLEDIQLADPSFFSPGSIDLILGADVYGVLLEDQLIKGLIDSPMAQATKLGRIVSGPTTLEVPSGQQRSCHVSVDRQLSDLVHRVWELEEVPSSDAPILSKEEQDCEDHFFSTHTRNVTGRYVIRLPFKLPPGKLGDSRAKALRIVTSLSNRLSSNTNYAKAYSEFMAEYEQLRHMERVPILQPEPLLAYYLPHHGVWREHSLTTR